MLFVMSVYLLRSMARRSRGAGLVIITLHGLLYMACTIRFALEFYHFYTYLVFIFERIRFTTTSSSILLEYGGCPGIFYNDVYGTRI